MPHPTFAAPNQNSYVKTTTYGGDSIQQSQDMVNNELHSLEMNSHGFSQEKDQLQEILQKIGVSVQHIHKFAEQEIKVQDLLLLTKDDLVEMKLPIACRNRILVFQRHLKEQQSSFEAITDHNSIEATKFDFNEIINKMVKESALGSKEDPIQLHEVKLEHDSNQYINTTQDLIQIDQQMSEGARRQSSKRKKREK